MSSPALPFDPAQTDGRTFRDALGRFATGVTVITALTPQGPLGMTANSFASVSLDPPLVLWSPARSSRRFAAMVAAQDYVIHVLGQDQRALCQHFAQQGHDFTWPGVTTNAQGVPVLPDVLARFECRQVAVHDGGDHAIIVGAVHHASYRDGTPLIFSAGRYGGFQP